MSRQTDDIGQKNLVNYLLLQKNLVKVELCLITSLMREKKEGKPPTKTTTNKYNKQKTNKKQQHFSPIIMIYRLDI